MPEKETSVVTKDIVSDDIQDIVNASRGYTDAVLSLNKLNKEYQEMSTHVKGDFDKLPEKLERFKDEKELLLYVKNDENVEELFTNEDGTKMEIVGPDGVVTEKESLELKRNIVLYVFQTAKWKLEINHTMEEFEKTKQEIERSMGTTANEIVIDRLRLTIEQKKEIETTEKEVPKSTMNKINCLLSGFDFNKQLETFQEHPSIIRNTIKDMKNQDTIFSLGKRYKAALKKNQTFASLISFISDTAASSFEEMYLPKEVYKEGYENLFLFSIIRYFAMDYWTENTKQMHAMTISLLQQLVEGKLPGDLKEQFINNIENYLKTFYDNV